MTLINDRLRGIMRFHTSSHSWVIQSGRQLLSPHGWKVSGLILESHRNSGYLRFSLSKQATVLVLRPPPHIPEHWEESYLLVYHNKKRLCEITLMQITLINHNINHKCNLQLNIQDTKLRNEQTGGIRNKHVRFINLTSTWQCVIEILHDYCLDTQWHRS